jgi:hypothetical protein
MGIESFLDGGSSLAVGLARYGGLDYVSVAPLLAAVLEHGRWAFNTYHVMCGEDDKQGRLLKEGLYSMQVTHIQK